MSEKVIEIDATPSRTEITLTTLQSELVETVAEIHASVSREARALEERAAKMRREADERMARALRMIGEEHDITGGIPTTARLEKAGDVIIATWE